MLWGAAPTLPSQGEFPSVFPPPTPRLPSQAGVSPAPSLQGKTNEETTLRRVPALALTGCATLRKAPSSSGPQFPHLHNEGSDQLTSKDPPRSDTLIL